MNVPPYYDVRNQPKMVGSWSCCLLATGLQIHSCFRLTVVSPIRKILWIAGTFLSI